jgi:Flp pilus assembly pilin Flp
MAERKNAAHGAVNSRPAPIGTTFRKNDVPGRALAKRGRTMTERTPGTPGKASTAISGLLKRTKGASLTEYGLLVGLVAVVAISSVNGLGGKVSGQFAEVADDLRIVRLVMTAERIHELPGDELFPAQSCYKGTADSNTLTSGSGGKADTADCFDGIAGANNFALASGPERDILFFMGRNAETVTLPAGNHWLVANGDLDGATKVTVGKGETLIDMRPWVLSDVEATPAFGGELQLVMPDGSAIRLRNHFPNEYVNRFVFADGEMTAADVRNASVDNQSTPNNDNMFGTPMDDTFVYRGGIDRILDPNQGFDTLDMSGYTRAQATFTTNWTSVVISVAAGEVELSDQLQYDIGDSTIDRVIFADGVMTDAELRAAAE